MKDLLSIIEEYGITLKREGNTISRGLCPLHDDKKPSFTFFHNTESWFCFVCGVGGDTIRLVAQVEKISYNDAKRKLIGTEAEQLEELKETLDNLDVDISQSYNLQLNLTLRPKFRSLLYKYPEHQQDILMAMKSLDEELKNKITFDKMGKLFERFKLFSEKIVAESVKV